MCVYYALTHNSITYPQVTREEGVWSIEKMQRPLALRLAGHNFLVLRDDKGKVVSELHGLATDTTTNTWKRVGTGRGEILHVWEFTDGHTGEEVGRLPGVVLKEGSEIELRTLWQKGKVCADKINEENIPYPAFGISMYETENSNSVAYTLMKCMGFNSKHIGLIVPGEQTDLLAK